MRFALHLLAACLAAASFTFMARADSPAPADVQILDDFEDISKWTAVASDGVIASLHAAPGVQGGEALVLDFDFARTAGYAAARRSMPVALPDDYEISFWMRGEAGQNNLEIKFVDASGDNVWWYRRANFKFSGDWQNIRIKRRQIEFAWGPGNDRTLHGFASIEFVISAGAQGGAGRLWFDRLVLKPIERPTTTAMPTAVASSVRKGHPAANVLDDDPATTWRSVRKPGTSATLTIDLQQIREFGGLQIDWVGGLAATQYTIDISNDGKAWTTVRRVTAGNGGRDSHLLTESEARWIRLTMADPGHDVAIAGIHVRDLEFGASTNAFVEALAAKTRRGCYPRSYYHEQPYWTVVGVAGDSEEGLLSEDGAIEARKGGFSVEPFVLVDGATVTWSDVTIDQSLADNYLPLPSVRWHHDAFALDISPVAAGKIGDAHLRVTYRVSNPSDQPRALALALAVRPFQVNPPSQFLNTPGGASPIHDLAWRDGTVLVDGVESLYSHTAADRFIAVPFDADTPCEWLASSSAAAQIHDDTGFASGALLYRLEIPAGGYQDVSIDLPQHPATGKALTPVSMAAVAAAADEWREKLNRVRITVPPAVQSYVDTMRSALAHVMINRDGPGLQPGSRSYERSWIRDGAMTSQMLLRLGHAQDAVSFLRWYADYQFANGKIPCCVDVRGADPVPENDSGGEFVFLVDEIHRYTGDRELLKAMWPRVVKAIAYMDDMRKSEQSEINRQGERRAFYGLMPASISHEGYSAKPVHSYWDDFWAIAGYESAVRIARALNEPAQMRKFIASRDQFRADLYRSLQVAMREHSIDYLPGSAELGDFDPTSTSIALSPGGEQQMLPPEALTATFERYWQHFDKRRTSKRWDTYTPYELRNVGTFIRLGWRDRAQQLLQFFMNDRRPAQWNQWAEVVGRDPREPRFLGDMPHGWVESDYVRSFLDMFAYERPVDETLVLLAGIPQEWIAQGTVGVSGLRTPYGELAYSFNREGTGHVFELGDIALPPGGIAISWPEKPRGDQSITAGAARWFGDELRVSRVPFRIQFSE
jgi:hypothetical protein